MMLRDSQGMNYDSKLQNMSWFCYIHVSTLSQTSMITWRSYNKTLPSSGGEPSSRISKSLHKVYSYEGTPSPWTNQSVAWCARELIWNEDDQSNRPRNTSHMHNWLGTIPEEVETCFLKFTAATCIKCTWTGGSHFLHPNICSMN